MAITPVPLTHSAYTNKRPFLIHIIMKGFLHHLVSMSHDTGPNQWIINFLDKQGNFEMINYLVKESVQ